MSVTGQIVLRSPVRIRQQPINRKETLLISRSYTSSSPAVTSSSSSSTSCCSSGFGEVAGGTTAECVAICCCGPCGLVKLVVMAVYKLPVGLCRRALKKKRIRQLVKEGLLPPRRSGCQCGCDDTELQIHSFDTVYKDLLDSNSDSDTQSETDNAVLTLEKEMWDTFYGTGFWRSPSQREPLPPMAIIKK